MPDIADQLRRYGEAVEERAMWPVPVVEPPVRWWRQRTAVIAFAVCLALVLAFVANLSGQRPVDVEPADVADEGEAVDPGDVVAEGEAAEPGDVAGEGDAPDPGPVPGDVVGEGDGVDPGPVPGDVVGEGDAPDPGPVPGGETTVRGTASWVEGHDPRGTLLVAACPAADRTPRCPNSRVASVAADGTYELTLPSDGSATTWEIAAFVAVTDHLCSFRCDWQSSQSGPARTVTVPRGDTDPVALSVSARVIDVRVVDPGGAPFPAGSAGVMVQRAGCDDCPAGYFSDDNGDGDVRIVVDPGATYSFGAMAMNTGWPDPWVSEDGQEFHFATAVEARGADLAGGTTFVVRPPG